jgi:hypothetical protein
MINFITVLAFPILLAAPPADSTAPPAPVDSSNMTLVVVQNDRSVPATVYLQDEVGEYKLGVVAPFATTTLSIKSLLLMEGDVQFFVHPAGQIDESTELMDLHRGERIGLVIPPR